MRVASAALLLVALAASRSLAQDTTSANVVSDTAAAAVDTSYAEYRESPITLPLGIGLRIPQYDRVNGLSLPWGPHLELGFDRLELDGLITYRSNLGKWDPSIEGTVRPGEGNEIRLFVGRSTFTNDGWIRADNANSLAALFVGSDARNYYRADRAMARYTRTLMMSGITVTPFLGANFEKDWSTGSLLPGKSPWSFYGRRHELRMRRPNPPIYKGRISSGLGGAGVEFFRGQVEGKITTTVEHAFKAPREVCPFPPGGGAPCTTVNQTFTQLTTDAKVTFPTFGFQTFSFRGHGVFTGSKEAPPQRFTYLGGAGTLATVDLLALGGDRLLYLEGDYLIPIRRIVLRFLGSPFLAVRYAAGSAGIGELPALIQNVGIGAGISFLRVDYSIDPAGDRSPVSKRSAFSIGVALPR